MHLLCFNLEDREYGVDIGNIRQVKRIKAVTPIPQAMDFIEGVVSLRGRVVPIINLRKKLGLSKSENISLNRVLITESSGHVLGIAVDSVIGVVSIDKSNIEQPDEILKKAEYLVGVGKIEKRLILIVDIEKLLSGEDRTGIQDIHNKVELKRRGN